ncbi:MAG: CorA family divalent cation transporter [Burkholderiaceae bacterium]
MGRAWLIISVTKRRLISLEKVRAGFDAGKAPVSPGGFLVMLSAELTERMEPVSASLADDIDDIEDRAFLGENGLGPEIASNRRKTVQLRRFVAAQRDALFKLAGVEIDLFTLMQRSRLRELSDRVTRLVEQMDEVKDRAQVVNDEIAAQRAETLARVSFVLSLAGVFFLPLGFLTGLLGVNLGGIPGTDSPWAFTVFCALLVAMGVVLAVVMRRVRLG